MRVIGAVCHPMVLVKANDLNLTGDKAFVAVIMPCSLVCDVKEHQIDCTNGMRNVCNLKPFHLLPMNRQRVMIPFNRWWPFALLSLGFWNHWHRLSLFIWWHHTLINIVIIEQTFPAQHGYRNLQRKHQLKTRWVNSNISAISANIRNNSTNKANHINDQKHSKNLI